ncbi:MAG: hypothetical protein JWR80_4991 [Bradyrhizobium sp.]|nr:hypothetical protein [Bradyrhizobium sp.]
MPSDEEILAAARVIAVTDDGCAVEAGQVPCVSYPGPIDEHECDCVRRAAAALLAAEAVREPVVFVTADGSHRCTVNGPQHILVQRLSEPGTA